MNHVADPRASFGQAVRRARNSRSISQEKLAELSGIHRTYIGDVERGTRNIALINMGKIACALGMRLGELIQDMEKEDGKQRIHVDSKARD